MLTTVEFYACYAVKLYKHILNGGGAVLDPPFLCMDRIWQNKTEVDPAIWQKVEICLLGFNSHSEGP